MSEWRRVKLGDLGRVVTGSTPPTKKPEYYDGNYQFVTPSDLVYDTWGVSKTERTISDEGHQKCLTRCVPAGAVMYTCIASIGKIGVAKDTVLTNQQINSIIANDENDGRFIYYLLRYNTDRIRGLNAGCAVPIINKTDFENIEVSAPPLPIQRRIADILSAYDDLIENNRRRIEILEETARTLYQKMFGNRAWSMLKLKEVAHVNQSSYSAKTLPSEIDYIDIASVSKGVINGKTHYVSCEAPGRARRIAKDGDVIWSNVRPNLKAYSLVLSPGANDVFSTGFSVVSAFAVPFTYLYFVMSAEGFVQYLDGRVTGATYPAVKPSDFEEYLLPVPEDGLLGKFHSVALPMFRQRELLSRQNAKLAAARDLLLPRLMSGKMSVFAAEPLRRDEEVA